MRSGSPTIVVTSMCSSSAAVAVRQVGDVALEGEQVAIARRRQRFEGLAPGRPAGHGVDRLGAAAGVRGVPADHPPRADRLAHPARPRVLAGVEHGAGHDHRRGSVGCGGPMIPSATSPASAMPRGSEDAEPERDGDGPGLGQAGRVQHPRGAPSTIAVSPASSRRSAAT